MYVTDQQEGQQELYPQRLEIRTSMSKKYKGYQGAIGGHTVLMFNNLLTCIINMNLFRVVLQY